MGRTKTGLRLRAVEGVRYNRIPRIWTAWRSIGLERHALQPEPDMSIAQSVAQILRDQVTLQVESIDRMYLNVYIPQLQRERGVVAFFRFHRATPSPPPP